jgi:hypothetical protein
MLKVCMSPEGVVVSCDVGRTLMEPAAAVAAAAAAAC